MKAEVLQFFEMFYLVVLSKCYFKVLFFFKMCAVQNGVEKSYEITQECYHHLMRLMPTTVTYLSCLPPRLNPRNTHQMPSVVVLCGPHRQGAQGISCARHLANKGVNVTVFLPSFKKMLECLTLELQMFNMTDGVHTPSEYV